MLSCQAVGSIREKSLTFGHGQDRAELEESAGSCVGLGLPLFAGLDGVITEMKLLLETRGLGTFCCPTGDPESYEAPTENFLWGLMSH